MFMRDNLSKLAGEGVFKLLDEQPEKAMEILEQFPDELNDPEKADALFKKSVEMLMDVTDYETMAATIQKQPDARDFSGIPNNHRKQDFDRKWNHTRAKVSTESLDALDENVADPRAHTEAEALADIALNSFWNSLSDEEHRILTYSMSGMTQQEIADKMGFKTHSAVTKRLAKIREKFPE